METSFQNQQAHSPISNNSPTPRNRPLDISLNTPSRSPNKSQLEVRQPVLDFTFHNQTVERLPGRLREFEEASNLLMAGKKVEQPWDFKGYRIPLTDHKYKIKHSQNWKNDKVKLKSFIDFARERS